MSKVGKTVSAGSLDLVRKFRQTLPGVTIIYYQRLICQYGVLWERNNPSCTVSIKHMAGTILKIWTLTMLPCQFLSSITQAPRPSKITATGS